jgi:glucosamine--fructose-6-phosphate aminotransferase (isomerizing)
MRPAGARMRAELREAPEVVARQAEPLAQPLADLVAALTRTPPLLVVTCARGSSAHAATFGKHLIERYLGLAVAPAAPNIAAVYRQRLKLERQLFLAISQSGRSDDLVETAAMAREAGALTAAIVNDTASPLADTCEFVLPMAAGPELSVAATKSFVAALAVLMRMSAAWTHDAALAAALDRLPERLAAAGDLDWGGALSTLAAAESLVAIGRGPTLAIAREAALKLKETCNLHAEPFSGAEFQHGPMALVQSRYPLLMFTPTDAAAAGLHELAADLARKGAAVFMTEEGEASSESFPRKREPIRRVDEVTDYGSPLEPAPDRDRGRGRQTDPDIVFLPALPPDHPETDAACLIQSFYGLAVDLAEQRGSDADAPRHLQKVTRTR